MECVRLGSPPLNQRTDKFRVQLASSVYRRHVPKTRLPQGEVRRKISAVSARAHTRKSHQSSSFKLSPGFFKKIIAVFFVGILAWIYLVIQPPPPKMCGSPNGPPVTAPRIRLKDGRHLAYKEHGVPRHVATTLSPEVIEELGVYIVSFDRPGYGESAPNPKQTVKSMAMDIEELADQLGLGSKFYVIGYSIGRQAVWSCLKYIPNSHLIDVFLPNFPANVLNEAFNQKSRKDQWIIRVAHYTPWLVYWWNTQKLFPASCVLANNSDGLSSQDKEITSRIYSRKDSVVLTHGAWEFDPLDLGNPFANNDGFDKIVPITMNRYIAEQLPWIRYHEVSGGGHFFPLADGMSNAIIKAHLVGEKY
ncbi:hypothetical protein E1A91_D04G118600v1 [Gossypium mustelinum]|uniref:AB hydrolase-1 domain-containing protein n=1 Tax=Gossypium mustelinum TaxID=34275 RepID=A0A5D2VCU9_GOSMU|nr:hypothetical protein E1A91_D04G118600v1 [Gossypium mustelinum]